MVPTKESTYHSKIIIYLVNAGFLLLVVRGAVTGESGVDVMTSTSANK